MDGEDFPADQLTGLHIQDVHRDAVHRHDVIVWVEPDHARLKLLQLMLKCFQASRPFVGGKRRGSETRYS